MMTWLTDSYGNKCSVEYWGSTEKAQVALDSLWLCINCINCSNCSNCWTCSDCSDCWACLHCSYCLRCSRCCACSHCSYCSTYSDIKNDTPKGAPSIPIIENIHARLYEAARLHLNMSTWHTCETTHCRAGWVIALAGAAGKKLEQFYNTELAAMLIYDASGYRINPARFYDSDNEALADMKRLAEADE